MSVDNAEQTGLTLTAEIDALGLGGHHIMSEAGGNVSGLELVIFRDAIAARVRQRTSTDEAEVDFEPNPSLPEAMQERLRHAHEIGSTVADILLHEQAIGDRA